ncbi:peptidoglycan recognition family protein [Isosphaeraceae bacterium EP7]
MRHASQIRRLFLALVALSAFRPAIADDAPPKSAPKVGARLARDGDEIVVCGQLYHTGTPVVTWMDPGGFDAYRVDRRFVPVERAGWKETAKEKALESPARYGSRRAAMEPAAFERTRADGWDLPTLQGVVDQFVIHYDVAGTSRRCFETLHDKRGLSVHFMLDLDGTIYQTLDLKDAGFHATIANSRSVGIEIANAGAHADPGALDRWYARGADGKVALQIQNRKDNEGYRDPSVLPLRPIRDELIVGRVQDQSLNQYDLTPQQYAALIKLTATLCTLLPRITCDYPRDPSGTLIPRKLAPDSYKAYHGILGHYHVQLNKTDPGPAFQWDKVIEGARVLLKPAP